MAKPRRAGRALAVASASASAGASQAAPPSSPRATERATRCPEAANAMAPKAEPVRLARNCRARAYVPRPAMR